MDELRKLADGWDECAKDSALGDAPMEAAVYRECAADLRAALAAIPAGGWRPIETAPEGKPVLLAIEYQSGRRTVIRAMRAGDRTLFLSDDQDPWDGCIYDEDEDRYYCAPGWYEKNQFDEVNWAVSEKPVAWQPLPASPPLAASRAQQEPQP